MECSIARFEREIAYLIRLIHMFYAKFRFLLYRMPACWCFIRVTVFLPFGLIFTYIDQLFWGTVWGPGFWLTCPCRDIGRPGRSQFYQSKGDNVYIYIYTYSIYVWYGDTTSHHGFKHYHHVFVCMHIYIYMYVCMFFFLTGGTTSHHGFQYEVMHDLDVECIPILRNLCILYIYT